MDTIRVFVDTNIFPTDKLARSFGDKKIKYVFSSVTEREMSGTDFLETLAGKGKVLETSVWDESCWNESVWGSEDTALEEILEIISTGSFPVIGKRDFLTNGEIRQLRDAMILETVIRDGYKIFLSNDKRAFIGNEKNNKRNILEDKFDIKIFTEEEYVNFTKKHVNNMFLK